MRYQRGFIDLTGYFVGVLAWGVSIGFLVGVIFTIAAPIIWAFIKPLIHSITA